MVFLNSMTFHDQGAPCGFYWGLRIVEVKVTTGAVRCAPVKMIYIRTHQHRFLQVRCPSCCPSNSVKALKGFF